VAELVDALS